MTRPLIGHAFGYSFGYFAAVAGMIVLSTAHAGQIDFSAGAVIVDGPGLGNVALPVASTPDPNNDNQDGSTPAVDNNVTVPIKRFDADGYIDIVFPVSATGGVTEYWVFENIDNNTGSDWIGFEIQLGYGLGTGFVPSDSSDALDFDGPNHDPSSTFYSTIFPNAAVGDDSIIFSGGIQSTGSQNYSFRLDVPDVQTNFTIRQIPAPIPEPATSWVLWTAAMGLGLRSMKRVWR